jgi:hypothetical protein
MIPISFVVSIVCRKKVKTFLAASAQNAVTPCGKASYSTRPVFANEFPHFCMPRAKPVNRERQSAFAQGYAPAFSPLPCKWLNFRGTTGATLFGAKWWHW